jgi:hypothetical protein
MDEGPSSGLDKTGQTGQTDTQNGQIQTRRKGEAELSEILSDSDTFSAHNPKTVPVFSIT